MDMPSTQPNRLYPAIEPFAHGRLKVSRLHEIYFEQCGNPKGRPVLIVHGGPGGGCNPTMRRYHDPARYRIILFDQRGCGRSTPHASLEDNTTPHLVTDMEQLRIHLGLERWQLFGGSWGSTLSLAYAQAYPDHVSALVLRGIFLARPQEVAWFYQDGCNWLFPDAFEAFQRPIPRDERHDMVAAYYKRLTDPNPSVRVEAARAWSRWEGATLSLVIDPDRVQRFGSDAYALAFARIECHYFSNQSFLPEPDHLLRNAHRLRHIPGIIAHGRYDVVTPLRSAVDLKQVWPEVDLRIVPDAGHAMTEPGLINELVGATKTFAEVR
jgi:proline iminopeptidase